MHYFIIAGEASGDLHAAALMEALAAADPSARFSFLGGDRMAAVAGHDPIIHYRDMAFMGFSEVLRHAGDIRRNMKIARRALLDGCPDCFIPVDYPSFNLRLARAAHDAGIPVYWYISPKVWAWKRWRVKTLMACCRSILCILPFEPRFYEESGYPGRAVYVGNPSVEEIDRALAAVPSREEFCRQHRLRPNRPILALLPGSRLGEIRCNLPVMTRAAHSFPQYNIVVAGAPAIPDEFYATHSRYPVIRDATHALLAHSHAALVTSGTATLEAALAAVPQVVTYRSNGSRLAYNIMKRLLHVSYVSLPNLIADAPVIPELLLHQCTPEEVARQLALITPENSPARQAQLEGYALMRRRLGPGGAADRAAGLIISQLNGSEKN